jgi:hypothetical protein
MLPAGTRILLVKLLQFFVGAVVQGTFVNGQHGVGAASTGFREGFIACQGMAAIVAALRPVPNPEFVVHALF